MYLCEKIFDMPSRSFSSDLACTDNSVLCVSTKRAGALLMA